ncbi:hypothetical protein B0H13DRAFT_2010258 [Mycena leptocephala]|nr:hypothetical protein B0H13DRAFT_2010258 [Mycena leptocephala]
MLRTSPLTSLRCDGILRRTNVTIGSGSTSCRARFFVPFETTGGSRRTSSMLADSVSGAWERRPTRKVVVFDYPYTNQTPLRAHTHQVLLLAHVARRDVYHVFRPWYVSMSLLPFGVLACLLADDSSERIDVPRRGEGGVGVANAEVIGRYWRELEPRTECLSLVPHRAHTHRVRCSRRTRYRRRVFCCRTRVLRRARGGRVGCRCAAQLARDGFRRGRRL